MYRQLLFSFTYFIYWYYLSSFFVILILLQNDCYTVYVCVYIYI